MISNISHILILNFYNQCLTKLYSSVSMQYIYIFIKLKWLHIRASLASTLVQYITRNIAHLLSTRKYDEPRRYYSNNRQPDKISSLVNDFGAIVSGLTTRAEPFRKRPVHTQASTSESVYDGLLHA